MSFVTRITPVSRVALAPARNTAALALRPALFSTTARQERGPVEATKETLKKADHAVSQAAVKGIEKGEKASSKMKDTFGTKSKQATHEAEKTAEQVKNKTSDLTDEAKKEAQEYAGKA